MSQGKKPSVGMNTQMKFTHEEEARRMWRAAESTDHNNEYRRLGHICLTLTRWCLAYIAVASSIYWDALFVKGAGTGYLSSLPGMKQFSRINPVLMIIGVFFVTLFYYFTVGCIAVVVLPLAGGTFGLLVFAVFALSGLAFGTAGGSTAVFQFLFTQVSGTFAWLAAKAPGTEAAAAGAAMWRHFWLGFGLFAAWTVLAIVMAIRRQSQSRQVAYSMDEGFVANPWVKLVPWIVAALSLYLNGYVLSLFAVFSAGSWTVKRWLINERRRARAQAVVDAAAAQDRLAADAEALRTENRAAYEAPMVTDAPLAVPPVHTEHEKRFRAAMAYAEMSPDFDGLLTSKGLAARALSPDSLESDAAKSEVLQAYGMHRAKNEELAKCGDSIAEKRVAQMRRAEAEAGVGESA